MADESERLVRGPRPGERPGGLGLTRMNFVADGDAAAVVDRARDVMLRLAGLPASAFNDVATGDLLPEWFLAAFARQPLAGQCPQDGEWTYPVFDDRFGGGQCPQDGDWTLEGWLYWADPGERPWRWWDARAVDADRGTIEIQVTDWPTPVGALSWLLLAAGATGTDYRES